MPESQGQESHADSHDRDKLDRWRQGLEQDEPGSFPVCAVFLVSENDGNAHDAFRRFRDSFETRNSGFHHVVIFGQHGVSTTVRGLLAEFALPPDCLPCLAMTLDEKPQEVVVVRLPAGTGEETGLVGPLLGQVETVIGGKGDLQLADIAGGISRDLQGRSLAQVAAALLART